MQARSVCLCGHIFATALFHFLLLGVCCCRSTAALPVGSQLFAEGFALRLGPQGSAGRAAQLNAGSGLVESRSRLGREAPEKRLPANSTVPLPRHGVAGHTWNGSHQDEVLVTRAHRPVQEAAEERRRRLGHSLQAATIPRIIHQVCTLFRSGCLRTCGLSYCACMYSCPACHHG